MLFAWSVSGFHVVVYVYVFDQTLYNNFTNYYVLKDMKLDINAATLICTNTAVLQLGGIMFVFFILE